jgi:hypothetical protein
MFRLLVDFWLCKLLSSGPMPSRPALLHRTFPTRDSRSKQGHAFANRFSKDWRLLDEEQHTFRGDHGEKRESNPRSNVSLNERLLSTSDFKSLEGEPLLK